MVLKQDGTQMPFEPTDFRVGLDIGICGRSIRINDCDDYTKEFFQKIDQPQGTPLSVPIDSF